MKSTHQDIQDDLLQLLDQRQRICHMIYKSPLFGNDYTNVYIWNKEDHPYKNLCNCLLWCEFWFKKIDVSNELHHRRPKFNSVEILESNQNLYDDIQNLYKLANSIRNKILFSEGAINEAMDLPQYSKELQLFREITPNLDFLRPKLEAMYEVIQAMAPIIERNKVIMHDFKQCFIDCNLSIELLEINLNKLVDKYGIDTLSDYAKCAWAFYDDNDCLFDVKTVLKDVRSFLHRGYYNKNISQGYRVGIMQKKPVIENFSDSLDAIIYDKEIYYIYKSYLTYNSRIINQQEKLLKLSIPDFIQTDNIESVKEYLDNITDNVLKVKGLCTFEDDVIDIFFAEFITSCNACQDAAQYLKVILNKQVNFWDAKFLEYTMQLYCEKISTSRFDRISAIEDGLGDFRGDPYERYKTVNGVMINKRLLWRFATRGYFTHESQIQQIELSQKNQWQIYHYKSLCLLNKLVISDITKINTKDKIINQLVNNLKDYVVNKNFCSIYKVALFFIGESLFETTDNIGCLSIQLQEIKEIVLISLQYNNFKLVDKVTVN
jgi:hypothetical protein